MSTAAAFGFGTQDKSATAAQRRRRAQVCLQSAVLPVLLEHLESRTLLAAGTLDPSFHMPGFEAPVGHVTEDIVQLMDPYYNSPFNPDGEETIVPAVRPVPPDVHLNDVAVEPGGKIVVVGSTLGHHLNDIDGTIYEVYDTDLWLGRYNADGTLDAYADFLDRNLYGYPNGWFWRNAPENSNDQANAVFVEPQTLANGQRNPYAGYITVTGTTQRADTGATFVWVGRWTPDLGTVTFNDVAVAGPVVTDVVRQADGKFVVVGSRSTSNKSQEWAMWRFNQNLTLDATFGSGGAVTINVNEHGFPSYDEITGAVVQSDGRIVVVGHSDDDPWQPNSPTRFIVQRFNANGAVDNGFGINGRVELGDFGGLSVRGESIALTPTGQIVVVGSLDDTAGSGADPWGADKMIVARVHAVADTSKAIRAGDLDRTFGGDGVVEIYDPNGNPWAGQDLAIQSDGKVVVTGQLAIGGQNRYGLARLTTNGNLDSTYGTGGRANFVSAEAGGLRGNQPISIVLQTDGQASTYNLDKAVLVGSTLTTNPHEIIRVLTDNRRPVATTHTPTVLITHQADNYSIIVTYYDDVSLDRNKVLDVTAIKVYRIDADGIPQELGGDSPIFGDPTVSVSAQDASDAPAAANYKRYVVTYTFALGRNWLSDDNGTYVVRLEPGKISDVNAPVPADALARELARFRVEIAEPDKTPPTVSSDDLKEGLSIGGRGKYTFTVTYTAPDYDESEPTRPGGQVDSSTIGAGDLLVTGPNGYYQLAEFIGVDSPTNGPIRVATYAISAPKTYWNSDNNGEYAVFILAGQVGDDYPAANYIPEHQFATLKVAIKGADVRPNASLDPTRFLPGALISAPTDKVFFEVKYARSVFANTGVNQVLMDAASLYQNNNVIRVTSPSGFNAFATYEDMTGKDLNGLPQNAEEITVTYSITPPDGMWDLNEIGTYRIAIVADAVRDSDTPANYVLPGNLGSFNIQITQGPTAVLGPISARLAPGIDPLQFTVTFSHPAGVDPLTIEDHASDLVRVIGPGGELFAVMQSITPLPSGDLQVVYHLAPPGGRWGAADNGTYTVSLVGGLVGSLTDPVGYTGAQDLGTFQVNVAPDLASAALGTVGTITTAGSELFFTVTFGSQFSEGEITGNDQLIRVVGPGGTWAVNADYISSVVGAGGTRTVTYRISGRGLGQNGSGRWDAADNGSYEVWLIADGLPPGNVTSDAPLGGFSVNVSAWQLVDGVLTVNGTDDADSITLTQSGNLVHLSIQSALVNIEQDFDLLSGSLPGYLPGEIGAITSIVVNALGGADTVDASEMTSAVRLCGGGGADTLLGGAGNDTVLGNGGADLLLGKPGNDLVRGQGGNDTVRGGGGDDTLQGGIGDDLLRAQGGNDVLVAGDGIDTLYGNGGDDQFFAAAGGADQIFGGLGTNAAQADIADDLLTDIQSLLA